MNEQAVSKSRTIGLFIFTIVTGFFLFALPNLLFGITKLNGGLTGINLLVIGVLQFVTVCALIFFVLKLLKKDLRYIGLSGDRWARDSLIGLLTGLTWAAVQFAWLIPLTGGTERADVASMVEAIDGTLSGALFFIGLGVIGGGITEEIFNRGFFISVLKEVFKNPRIGIWVAAILSVLFFAVGHLPTNAVEWIDILIPTIAYTILFLATQRLTAPIVAHSVYNTTAILLTYYLYST